MYLKNYGWKLPKPKEGNRYPGTGSPESPNKMNSNRPTSRHTIVKMAKVKDTILKAAREKELAKREPP